MEFVLITLGCGMTNLITLAGRGDRFLKGGCDIPKPLVKVNGNYMIHEAIKCLPKCDKYVFVCLTEHKEKYDIDKILYDEYPNSTVVLIDEITEGQACTAEVGIIKSGIGWNEPLLISSCDYGLEWDEFKYKSLDSDVIVWTTLNNESFSNNPESYSWLDVYGETLIKTHVKQKVFEDSYNNHAIVGTFYFKKTKYFLDGLGRIYDNDIKSNGEFYIDNIFNALSELNIKIFDVNKYHCWGTPEELKKYEN